LSRYQLGLTGIALDFALKDAISNLISGVLILLYSPFEIGSRIKIAGYEGVVVTIDLRYTELDSERDKILIPNSKLFTDTTLGRSGTIQQTISKN
jgi:small-conductance mechanosensitive channel